MISIPQKSPVSEKLSCSNGANSRVCFYFHTHLFTYTHTHTHTPLAQKRQDREVGRASQLPGAHYKCEVASASSSASTQRWCHLGGGACGFLPLSLSLSPTFIMLYLLWTLGGAGERRMSIEQPWIGSLSGHFMCLCWRPPEALFVLYEHYVCLKNNVMEFRCREKAEQFISTSMHLFKSEQWVFFILVIWVCVCTRESC